MLSKHQTPKVLDNVTSPHSSLMPKKRFARNATTRQPLPTLEKSELDLERCRGIWAAGFRALLPFFLLSRVGVLRLLGFVLCFQISRRVLVLGDQLLP